MISGAVFRWAHAGVAALASVNPASTSMTRTAALPRGTTDTIATHPLAVKNRGHGVGLRTRTPRWPGQKRSLEARSEAFTVEAASGSRRRLEERPGLAGALRTLGGMGGHVAAPHPENR